MGVLTALLSAIGCAPTSKRPTLTDYDAVLHLGRTLKIDPKVATSGRYEILAGPNVVLELRVVHGSSAIAYDKGAHWSVAMELPPGADPTQPLSVSLAGIPVVARVAGEDVLFLAQKGTGQVRLSRTSAAGGGTKGEINGEIDAVFEPADRDLIKLGAYKLAGTFRATISSQ